MGKIRLSVLTGKNAEILTQTLDLPLASGDAPVKLAANGIKNGKFILSQDDGLAPDNLTVQRIGDDLAVSLDGAAPEQPQLIIENFYQGENTLAGLAEDGSYHAYIGAEDANSLMAQLTSGMEAGQVLGALPLTGMSGSSTALAGGLASGGGSGLGWLAAAAGLGGLAVIGTKLADGGDKGDGNGNNKIIPARSTINSVTDNAGFITGVISNGGATDDQQPIIGGGGKAGDTITIFDFGKVIGTTLVGADGTWIFRPTSVLTDGQHSLTTTDTDGAGTSAPSSPYIINVDSSIPAAPVIGNIIDAVIPVTGIINRGGSTNDSQPTLTGTGKAGDSIVILDNGDIIDIVLVKSDGTWSFKPDTPLGDGTHNLTTVEVNPVGTVSDESATFVLKVDTVPPAKPAISGVTDNAGQVTGALLSGSVTDDERPVMRGTAEANSIVTIYDNGTAIGTAVTNASGTWRFTPTLPLVDGLHAITVITQDAAGNRSIASDPFSFTLDGSPPPAAPAITGMVDAVGAILGSIDKNGITDDSRPVINGTAQAGTRVSVYDAGVLIGTAITSGAGTWTFRPTTILADGAHFITATATSATGNSSVPTTTYSFNIDTSVPPAPTGVILADDVGPVTGDLANGAITDDANPTLRGNTLAGATVSIWDNGVKIDSVVADASGAWSHTLSRPLLDGSHVITTQSTNVAGTTGPSSAATTITVDTSAVTIALTQVTDAVGTIQGPLTRGAETDDARPTLSGTATANSTINIYDGASFFGTTTANASGVWNFRSGVSLSEGAHSFTVESVNGGGVISPRTTAFDLTVDLTAPDAPAITSVIDDVGVRQGNLTNGGASDDTTPTLNGINRTVGETISVYDNGVLLGRTTVGGDGSWSYTTPSRSDGVHSFTVTATDAAGNVGVASSPFALNIDTVAPAKPIITSVIDAAGDVTGALTSGSLTDDATPTLNGTAEANSTINIYNNTTLIGTTITNASGVWSFIPGTPLLNGSYNLTAVAQDAAGNVGAASDNFNFSLDAGGKPAAPAITGIVDDVGSIQGVIAKNGFTDDPTPTMRGTAQAGSTVSVYDGVTLLGTVLADVNGNWSLTRRMVDGNHSITATATSATGNVSPATGAYVFGIDTSTPAVAGGQTLTDDVGLVTGQITNGMTTDDANPTLSGSALANATIRIYDGNQLIGTALVKPDGNWSFTPLTPLADGTHSLTTIVVNGVGSVSAPSAALIFTIDTSVAVAITELLDDVGSIQGPLAKNGVTDDQRPAISGSATPGATINVYDGATLLGSTSAGINGQWNYIPPTNLAEGAHSITVEAVNGGVTSPRTAAFGFTVDITPPAVLTITGAIDDVGMIQGTLSNGAATDDTTPTLTGTGGVAGDRIAIYDGSSLIGQALVQAGGNWSFTPTSPLLNSVHSFTVKATDAAGNSSAASTPFVLTINTTPPTAVATVKGMSKDDGLNSSDFVTNDGSAGRGVYGTLSAALASGETLRVSTNGGASWTNAVVNGSNWSVVDGSTHNASWTIQTQVVNAAGNVTLSSQLVTLDTIAPNAPTSITQSGSVIIIGLAGTNAVAGDMLNMLIANKVVLYTLTTQDIARGNAQVAASSSVPAPVTANIIDIAGNASAYLNNGVVVEGFDNVVSETRVDAGGHYTTPNLDLQVTLGNIVLGNRSTTNNYGATGPSIWVGRPGHEPIVYSAVTVSHFGEATAVQFTYGQIDFAGANKVEFFNTSGVSLGISTLDRTVGIGNDNAGKIFSYVAPAGQLIGSFVISVGDPAGIVVDTFVISTNSSATPLSNNQIIDTATHAFYGSTGNDVFSLADTTFLSGINAGVHGGAGADTLKLTGANMTLDLTGLTGYNDQGKISSIEKIDLTGTGNNTLKLSLNDVLHLGQTNLLVADGKTQFAVTGNGGDAVVLSKMHDNGVDTGAWVAQPGVVTVGGVTYMVYEHSTLHAELFVQQGVATTLV